MNSKIKELAEQSGFYFYDLHDIDGQDLGETIEADSWSCAEKFAELIVKECAKIADERQFKHRNNYPISIAIEEHFGVE